MLHRKGKTILCVLVISACSLGTEIIGTVQRVMDGDTIAVHVRAGNICRVRLYGIDAPEIRQSYGLVAKFFLVARLSGKIVVIQSHQMDRYHRIVGTILCDGNNINQELVKNGLAWHDRRYAPNAAELASQEINARKKRLGLWSERAPIAPWNYRKGVR